MIPVGQPVLPPSPVGDELSSADLMTVDYNPDTIAKIIAEGQPDVLGLLASILKNQKRNNSNFQPAPYSLAVYNQQQIFPANPRRSYLLIQNVSAGDVLVVFEVSSVNVQDFSADTNALISKQTRSIRIVGGGYFEPLVAPTNAITLFSLNASSNGVVIEGI